MLREPPFTGEDATELRPMALIPYRHNPTVAIIGRMLRRLGDHRALRFVLN